MNWSRPLLVALLFAVAAVGQSPVAATQGAQLLTPEGLVAMVRMGEPQLSPDGAYLLYTVRRIALAENRGRTEIVLLPLSDPTAARVVGTGSEPRWFAGGEKFAFVAADGLHLQSLDGAVDEQVDLGVPIANLAVSRDGGKVSFTHTVQVEPTLVQRHPDLPLASARVYDDLMVRHWDHWRDGSYSHLFTASLEDKKLIDLLAGAAIDTPLVPFGGGEQICWSPDGTALCYTAKKVADPERSTDSGLYVCAANGMGRHVCITEGMPGFDQDPAWSPDGTKIAFCSMARAGFEADRVRLMVHDVRTGKNEELLPDFDASVHELTFTSDSSRLFFTVETLGTTQLFTAALDAKKPIAVTTGRHALSSIQVRHDGQKVYALRTAMELPAAIVEIDVATGAIRVVADANQETLAQLALPTVEGEWFEATDGKKIHAWIVKPKDFDPTKKYPFVLFCQGGPQSMVGQAFSYRWNFHLMAAKGYVVAGVNRRGLPGFGQAWNDQISRDWGGQAMRDLLSVTDAMQARSYIDKARSAAVGASFGGFSVYWLMGNAGDRFACMIGHCGVFNLDSMLLSTEEQWFTNWDLGEPAWTGDSGTAEFERFSPHRYVKNWKTPLLVIHGEQDFRVPYDQGLQAFTAAQMQGVPSRLLMFPGEGHWVLQPQNGVVWQREFFAWLDRYCALAGK